MDGTGPRSPRNEKRMKTKIISIMNHPPAYDWYADKPRPAANWDTPSGQWVGIWGYDWPDQLGKAVCAETGEFDYEVWQPDLRAERIYQVALTDGLVHRQFPATRKKTFYGVKRITTLSSFAMADELRRHATNGRVVLHLNGDPLSFRELFSSSKGLPTVVTYLGTISLPLKRLMSPTRNIPSKINDLIDHCWLRRHVGSIDVVVHPNNGNIDELRRLYRGEVKKLTMGCDFTYWRRRDRIGARLEAGLPVDKRLFLSASNLIDRKQIDKLIGIFDELRDKHEFVLIVAGHGSAEYEKVLRSMASDLLKSGKILFTGYLTDRALLTYYSAADFFLSTSSEEGGPVSVMQALACELPVISTRTGSTSEMLAKTGCGCLLDVHDYAMWKDRLEEILEGKRDVRVMEREAARRSYDWPNIARGFIEVYRTLEARK